MRQIIELEKGVIRAFVVRGKGVDVGVDAAPTETTSDNITKPPPIVSVLDHTVLRQRNDDDCLYQKGCSELEWVVMRTPVVRRMEWMWKVMQHQLQRVR